MITRKCCGLKCFPYSYSIAKFIPPYRDEDLVVCGGMIDGDVNVNGKRDVVWI